jgi:hypothetical protein
VEIYKDICLAVKRSKPTAITGTELSPAVIAPRQIAPADAFLKDMNQIVDVYGDLWHKYFNGRKDWIFQKITSDSADSLSITAEDWANIIFHSINVYQTLDEDNKNNLLIALTAVFYGRLLTWLQSGYGLSISQMESLTEEECCVFEAKRTILLEEYDDLPKEA